MLKLLVVAATRAEAGFLPESIKKAEAGILFPLPGDRELQIDLLITGPGITSTTYHLTRILAGNRYDLALNIGLCGSLDPAITPVHVVNIIADQFGDFGAEDGKDRLDVFEMGLVKKNDPPFKNGKLFADYREKLNTLKALPSVEAITVQRVHGSDAECRKAFEKFGPVMESMEGAAFFYVCRMEKVPCLQIRAVSNRVERRNRSSWKVEEALQALAGCTGLLLLELESRDNEK